jgi:hypothetical protein
LGCLFTRINENFKIKDYFLGKMFSASKKLSKGTKGLGLGEEGGLKSTKVQFSTNVDRITNVQLLPSAPILPNPC